MMMVHVVAAASKDSGETNGGTATAAIIRGPRHQARSGVVVVMVVSSGRKAGRQHGGGHGGRVEPRT